MSWSNQKNKVVINNPMLPQNAARQSWSTPKETVKEPEDNEVEANVIMNSLNSHNV